MFNLSTGSYGCILRTLTSQIEISVKFEDLVTFFFLWDIGREGIQV